ncbi:MAG: hypothetical protein IPH51_22775 [Rubrivivax sp.]|nr:hypothetical protein [Rubrivivax sp.]
MRSKPIEQYSDLVRRNFSRVALLDKLRETERLSVFSRICGSSNTPPSQRWKLISRTQRNWLPAVVVRGEGISWSSTTGASLSGMRFGAVHKERLKQVNRNLQAQAQRVVRFTPTTLPCLVLLHTFAHILISQLVFDCGYGSSSLRERIYFSETHPQMTGVLESTPPQGSEGTMGGLVRMGEPGQPDEQSPGHSIEARWCSSDLCASRASGQGPDKLQSRCLPFLCLLPETSCEMQNRLLDQGHVEWGAGPSANRLLCVTPLSP